MDEKGGLRGERDFRPFPTASREAFFLAADTAEGRRRLSLTFPLNLPFNLLSFWGGALHFQAPRLPYAGRRQLAPHIFGGEKAGNLRGEPDL